MRQKGNRSNSVQLVIRSTRRRCRSQLNATFTATQTLRSHDILTLFVINISHIRQRIDERNLSTGAISLQLLHPSRCTDGCLSRSLLCPCYRSLASWETARSLMSHQNKPTTKIPQEQYRSVALITYLNRTISPSAAV